MTGGIIADIVLPIVIAIALGTWLGLLFFANRHPHQGRYSKELPTEVRGGSFHANEGGRQVMPIPDHAPRVPGQRAAGEDESYRVPDEPVTGEREDAGTRPLAGRSVV